MSEFSFDAPPGPRPATCEPRAHFQLWLEDRGNGSLALMARNGKGEVAHVATAQADTGKLTLLKIPKDFGLPVSLVGVWDYHF